MTSILSTRIGKKRSYKRNRYTEESRRGARGAHLPVGGRGLRKGRREKNKGREQVRKPRMGEANIWQRGKQSLHLMWIVVEWIKRKKLVWSLKKVVAKSKGHV